MRSLVACVIVAAFPVGIASAQPTYHRVDTLEWMVADSPAIVRATVVDFAGEADRPTDSPTDTVVVRVLETLKGDNKPFHMFTVSNRSVHDALSEWKQGKNELLIFLTDQNRDDREAQQNEFRPREVATGVLAIYNLSREKNKQDFGRVYTGDLRDVTEPDSLLAKTRANVESNKGQKVNLAHDVCWPQGAKNVIRRVPVDERLKNEAGKWARSNEPALQAEGQKALKRFSDQQ